MQYPQRPETNPQEGPLTLLKCDEKLPRCGNCEKKKRHCHYSINGRVIFVAETVHTVAVSHGETAPPTKPIPFRPVQSRFIVPRAMQFSSTSQLAARWVSMIGGKPQSSSSLRVLGSWITDIPSRLGHTPALDSAAAYALDSTQAHLLKTDKMERLARSAGLRALQGLREAKWDKCQRSSKLDLLLAVKLHFASEE